MYASGGMPRPPEAADAAAVVLPPEPVSRFVAGRTFSLLIGGRLRPAVDGSTVETIDPSTGGALAPVPDGGDADVELAYEAAAAAQPAWAAAGIDIRSEVLLSFADVLERNAVELATLDSINGGLPFAGACEDLAEAIACLRRWPSLVRWHGGRTIPASLGNLHYTSFRPYGVVGRILAYNHPALFAIGGTAAALLAGNAVIVKPAPQAPLSALVIAELAKDVFPPGVFNVISGGVNCGQALVSHPKIKRIAFTGSVSTGQRIVQSAAAVAVKNVSLELGGKNAMIVFPDADLDRAVDGAVRGMNFGVCAGQSCGSNSRTYVHERIYSEFVERVAERLDQMQVGPAYAQGTDIGPLITAAHRDRVLGYVRSGIEEGARVVTAEASIAGTEGGFFMRPTLLADVQPPMRVAREEIFGPVMSMASWRDPDAVIRLANNTEYGLTGSVWTSDLDTAHRVAERLEAGYVWVNQTAEHYFGTPFGGHKNSGLGREECLEEYESYLEAKAVHIILNEDLR